MRSKAELPRKSLPMKGARGRMYTIKRGILSKSAAFSKMLFTVAWAVVAIALNVQLSQAQPDPETLKLLLWQAPTTLNPHFADGSKDQVASRISYEPLASFDRDGKLVPFLAADIPSLDNGGISPDGKSVIWKLKPNVKWSDGQAFTAKDVVFTYNFIINPDVESTSGDSYKNVEAVEALDDVTVKVTFKSVDPAWAAPFVGVRGLILPEHVFAPYMNATAASAPPNLAPVGTGPYIAKSFSTEDVLIIGDDVVNTVKIQYEPNPYYRDASKLSFKQVTLQGGGDAKVAAKAVLQDGVVDYAWNLQVPDQTLTDMEASGKGRVVPVFGSYVERIMLNFSDPIQETPEGERSSKQFPNKILSDRQVRQALSLAVDRDAIAKLYGRTGQPSGNLLVSPTRYKSPNTTYEFNLAKAAEILDAAGWKDHDGNGVRDKDGVDLRLVYQTSVNPVRQKTQDIVSEALTSIGIDVEKKLIDGSIFFSSKNDSTNTTRHFYADLEEFAHGNKGPDPGAEMLVWVCEEAAQMENGWAKKNISRYCNADYDKLYEQSKSEMDAKRRDQLFIQMNDLLTNDFAVIPLVHWADTSGISNKLEGYDPTPWDSETWNIADWHRK